MLTLTPTLLAGLTGVMQGARHALEPDHVTAVATVMVEAPSPRRGMFYAACWGVGHAAMLVFVAGPLVALRVELPAALTILLELAVGVMLVYLGIRTLLQHKQQHAHAHAHPHPLHDQSAGLASRGRRPFMIGIMHGLAGSGALAAFIALGAPTVATGLGCLALYAIGTVIGMVALAALAGPMLRRVGQVPRMTTMITRIAGATSIIVGIVWAVRTLAAV